MAKHLYPVKKSKKDPRDFIYLSSFKSSTQLPVSVDLRSKMSPIVDQGQLGSCTANAIGSGLMEYLELKNGVPFVRLSREFLYWEERKLEGTVNSDAGAEIKDGMKVLNKIGICPEVDDPYIISEFKKTPTAKAVADAAKYKISEYHKVLNLVTLKAALADGLPVVFGFKVYESFESDLTARTGKVTMPGKNEKLLGGHAVLAVGFIDTLDKNGKPTSDGNVIVRNSWGTSWGLQGYFMMPYNVFNKLLMDMWTGN